MSRKTEEQNNQYQIQTRLTVRKNSNKEDTIQPKTPTELKAPEKEETEATETRRRKIAEDKAEADKKLQQIKAEEDLHNKLRAEKKLEQEKIEQANKDQEKQAEKRLQQAEAEEAIVDQEEIAREKQRQEIKKAETNKMAQQQIQQQIASFVPEFSGEGANTLTRFIGTATTIYEGLKTDDERDIFNTLIKFRLTGDAYTRIQDREIKDFKELVTTLRSMYSRTYSLSELERIFTQTQQMYGETVKNYGYRLCETLNKYKRAFKVKYALDNIGEEYNRHLQENSVEIFKRGLNNMILKQNVATSKASNLEEIIEAADTMEKMLSATTGAPDVQPLQPSSQPQWTSQFQQQATEQPRVKNTITCNYCQKPNHTWDKCRTRMYAETANMRRQYVPNPNTAPQYRQYQPNNQYQGNRPQYNPRWNYQNSQQQNTQNNSQQYSSQNRYSPPQQNSNFNSQNTQPNNFRTQPATSTQFAGNRQHKYCSHCKVTTGHTFDECRSKFFNNPNPNQRNPNIGTTQQKSDTRNLEEDFNRLRINRLAPQQQDGRNATEQPQYPENPNGSSQP